MSQKLKPEKQFCNFGVPHSAKNQIAAWLSKTIFETKTLINQIPSKH